MPTTPAKNLLYRAALPILAPHSRGQMTHHISGHPLTALPNYERILAKHHVFGASLLLQDGANCALCNTSTAKPEHLAQENTRYRVASITKMATALVTLRCIDNGLFALDSEAASLLPDGEKAPALSGVTVRHLLCHTSGLRDLPILDDCLKEGKPYTELLRQPEPEARDVALAIELFTEGSLNTFAKPTNVDTDARILCYDIRDLGRQLLPVGMLVVLDSIFNRIIRNRGLKRNTWIYIDEIYLLFQHEYSANFLFTLWKRMRKYQACGTGISQNIEDLLQSHTARTMLANSEFLVLLNQAATDREELARLLNISDNQLSYITNVDSGRGLIKCGSAIVPFVDHFPKNKLYQMMTTKPSDLAS